MYDWTDILTTKQQLEALEFFLDDSSKVKFITWYKYYCSVNMLKNDLTRNQTTRLNFN